LYTLFPFLVIQGVYTMPSVQRQGGSGLDFAFDIAQKIILTDF